MKVAIVGASGFVGSALLEEAVARGHIVSALVSDATRVCAVDTVTAISADVMDNQALAQHLAGHDALITAFSGHAQQDVRAYYMQGMRSIVAAAKAAGMKRLLVVGGAGGLEIAPGLKLLDSEHFPKEWRATAEGAMDALEMLRSERELTWTVLAPSAHLEPGQRTGSYRLGRDTLIADAEGHSRISLQDYAKAMIDELEAPAHTGTRFTVGY